MIFRSFKGGFDRNFCYLLANELKEAILIDPFNDERIFKILENKSLKLKYIINTHSHFDHIEGNKFLVGKTNAKVIMNENTNVECDIKVKDDEELSLEEINLRFIYTPGHIKDGMCILANEKILFTGDLLFVGKVGGTGPRFLTSNAKEQWESLQEIMQLDKNIEIYPGHDYGNKESSTISNERKTNPFLLCRTYEEFINLKENWLGYKKKYNIK